MSTHPGLDEFHPDTTHNPTPPPDLTLDQALTTAHTWEATLATYQDTHFRP